jgi:hypothetical protein
VHTASKSRNTGSFPELLRSVLAAQARTATLWADEDFATPDLPNAPTADPWSPFSPTAVLADEQFLRVTQEFGERNAADSQSTIQSGGSLWFDETVDVYADETALSSPDWIYEISLPNFIPDAARNPFAFDATLPSSEDFARRRARWLVDLLDIAGPRLRSQFSTQFLELFTDFPFASTFSSLADLAINGVSPEDIWAAYELKQLWANTPSWWHVRPLGKRQAFPTRSLSWVRATLFAARRRGIPSEQIIEPRWYDEWLLLSPYDPLYYSFLLFAEARINAFEHGYLDLPDEFQRRHLIPSPNENDDFGIVNNASRTGMLARCETDRWSFTAEGQERNDILTPKRTTI